MHTRIIKALVDAKGKTVGGQVVPMPAGSYHEVSGFDLDYYLGHPDVFTVYAETSGPPVYADIDQLTGGITGISDGLRKWPLGFPLLPDRALRLAFVGDSITAGSNQTYPRTDYDCGYGLWDAMTMTNLTSAFIVKCWPGGECANTDTVSVVFDGTKYLTVAVAGEAAGTPVDVSAGGFFRLTSSTNGKGVVVQVRFRGAPVGTKTDTTTINSGTMTRSIHNATMNSWWYAGLARAGYSDATILNFGIGGDTAVDILSRISQVTNESPDVVFLHCGTNDISQISSVTAIIDYLVTRVPVLVVVPVLPRGKDGASSAMTVTQAKQQSAFWRATKNYALGKGNCIVYDAWSTVVDPAVASGTGLVNANCFNGTDFLHPNLYGTINAIGPDFYSKITSKLFSSLNQFTASGGDIYDATYNPLGNLMGTSGTFVGSGGAVGANPTPSGTLATGWTDSECVGGTFFTSVVYSQPARTDGYNGNTQRVVLANASGGSAGRQIRASPNLTGTLSAGTKARARISVRITNATLLNLFEASFKVGVYNFLFDSPGPQIGGTITDSGWMYFTSRPFIVPAGLGTCDWFIKVGCASTGGATIDLADAVVEAVS